MSKTLQKAGQNQSMDLCKMIAATLVVVVHEPFPGRFGELVILAARFAVPMFLVVTGYFNYGADARTIARRLFHIIKLTLIACAFYILSNSLNAWLNGVPIWEFLAWDLVTPGIPAMTRWLILHHNPYSEHLWYLTAVTLCYGLLWVYVSFRGGKTTDYRFFYQLGLIAASLLIYTAILLPWGGSGMDNHIYRNGWLTGLTMFTLGLFLHEYKDTLRKNLHLSDKVLVLILLGGICLSLCEWYSGITGETTLGTLTGIPALMLLVICHPQLPVRSPLLTGLISRFRSLSTGMYILHGGLIWVYYRFFSEPLQGIFGEREVWLRPIGVLLLTIPAAIVWDRIDSGLQKKRK